MAMRQLENIGMWLQRLVGTPPTGDQTDRNLLERFGTQHDERAFEALLARHGPLVLGVCRRVLTDAHDADDAFQATFLVLVRKASSLGNCKSLASWLYTVAYHIALKARAGAARRRELEKRSAAMSPTEAADDGVWRFLRPVLDEELGQLPEKYRAPIVLCYLRGKTNEEAAQELGWTKGTVSGRLARARELLRGRLSRRGITLSTAGLGAILVEQQANALPLELGRSTLKSAMLVAKGGSLTAVVSAPVAILVEGTVSKLSHAKLRLAVAALLACCGLLAAALTLYVATRPPPEAVTTITDNPAPGAPRPVVMVEAVYPGASAEVVAQTVAGPIERQIQGADKILFMNSQCGNDGSYTLGVTFEQGVDLDKAEALVRSRVQLALPALPAEVQRHVSVKQASPGVLMIVSLSSPAGAYDGNYLSSYATGQLDDLIRIPGVGSVTLIGKRDPYVQIKLDPERLERNKLTASDVVRTLREQDARDATGPVGQPGKLGKFAEPEVFGEIVLRGQPVLRIKDVARVEMAWRARSHARLNGQDVVAAVLYASPKANPQEATAALHKKLAQLRARLPEGLALEVLFELAAQSGEDKSRSPEYFLIDVTPPDSASMERTFGIMENCRTALQEVDGVQEVLALSEQPFELFQHRGCMLVRLAPPGKRTAGRDQILRTAGDRLRQRILDAVVRLRDLSGPSRWVSFGYPVDLAVHGPDPVEVWARADLLAHQLRETGKLTDIGSIHFSGLTLSAEIDRDAVKQLGVSLEDVQVTLQVVLGGGDFNQFGGNWQVTAGDDAGRWQEALHRLMVRDNQWQMEQLSRFVMLREGTSATYLRLNGQPMARVTANLAPGVSWSEARSLCESLASKELPKSYRLTWLQVPGSAQ
jgi:RNA polymerase sigma factor (sigma-70 family)